MTDAQHDRRAFVLLSVAFVAGVLGYYVGTTQGYRIGSLAGQWAAKPERRAGAVTVRSDPLGAAPLPSPMTSGAPGGFVVEVSEEVRGLVEAECDPALLHDSLQRAGKFEQVSWSSEDPGVREFILDGLSAVARSKAAICGVFWENPE